MSRICSKKPGTLPPLEQGRGVFWFYPGTRQMARLSWPRREKLKRVPSVKRILSVLIVPFLGGCFGVVHTSPLECPASTRVRDAWVASAIEDERLNDWMNQKIMPTKADFLAGRGAPDEVIPVGENEEVWVYEYAMWCGAVVGLGLIPAPFMLPVCDGIDRIVFRYDSVDHVQPRRLKTSGFMLTPGSWKPYPPWQEGNDCHGYWTQSP